MVVSFCLHGHVSTLKHTMAFSLTPSYGLSSLSADPGLLMSVQVKDVALTKKVPLFLQSDSLHLEFCGDRWVTSGLSIRKQDY